MSRASYQISVGGLDVTPNFSPLLISLEISESDGGKSDQCTITLDDKDGSILLPETGSQMEVMLWWIEPPPGVGSGAAQFIGVTDEPKSHGSRHQGRILTICAHSADLKGKGKQKTSKHYDQKKFKDVAEDLGQKAGYQVSIDQSLASLERDYWVCAHESFLSWGRRISDEIGAAFKTAYPKAAFIPRNTADSASGKALAKVNAVVGVNVISWEMAPILSRGLYQNSKVRIYDRLKAAWDEASQSIGSTGAEADLRATFKQPDKGRATDNTKTGSADAKRKQGGGHVELQGEPAAQPQAQLTLSGARPGIDGTYLIKSTHHRYHRHQGWITTCEVVNPSGSAGDDSRGSSSSD